MLLQEIQGQVLRLLFLFETETEKANLKPTDGFLCLLYDRRRQEVYEA